MASLATEYYQFLLAQGVCSTIGLSFLYSPALAPKKTQAVTLAAPFKEFPFVMMLLGMFILMYGIFIPVNFLALQGLEHAHVSESMSLYLVAIFNSASLFGRLGSGYWSNIAGRWNVFIIAGAASGIIELALWIPATYEAATIGFAVAFGFLSGAFVSLLAALPATVSPLPEIGYRIGVVMLILSLPALTMAPIGGSILQSASSVDDGWLHVKIFGGVMSLAGSAVVFYAKTLYTKKVWAVF
ncbi:major facilitator superfamily domain-containing protein [Microdochium trichocladiopsis]|uniref:Major facilitator superfamily domain-containing protein n=1 Tax=Microdochium trichocladiopsis TaxID=1682393 RepID=A0A9P8XPI7_9PEZI|nr:major facilitator superfamily domain-containing protein [Microdochium trichocladiopsis]KAH7009303.1 major facilitator superfamily domain-containing protein [Microdochium trichocladiopsis]